MRLSAIRFGVLLVPACLAAAGAASAQPVPASISPPGLQKPSLRGQISIMEASLERAVVEGIRGAQAEMPELLSGPWMFAAASPRARGFRIDNYGVFFDVEVPGLPASITWSMQIVNRDNDLAISQELAQMRALIATLADRKAQSDLIKAVNNLQQHVPGAVALSEPSTRAALPANTAPPPSPGEVYTRQVRTALVAVMLQQGQTLEVGPEDWVTVAASDSQGSGRLAPGEPDLLTMYLSIKGKDLAALRARQISPEEAVRRIVTKNY